MRTPKRLVEEAMCLTIKQVVDSCHLGRAQAVSIKELPNGAYFPAVVTRHDDHIEVKVAAGWGDTEQRIELTETPCHYGGTRKWFLCPECFKRCGVLFINGRIACRTCHGLKYSSQYEHAQERMLRRLKQIRRATGSDDDIWGPFGLPPRGMSVKRWKALIQEFNELREKYWRECEKPRKWRYDAPSAKHWKVGPRIPLPPT